MRKILALSCAVMAITSGASAQDTTATDQPGTVTVAAPAAAAQPAANYLRSEHQDWIIVCSPAQGNQCFMIQRVNSPNGQPLLEFNMVPAKVEGEPDAVMGVTITTPLNVLLPRGLFVEVDGHLPDDPYDYQYCGQVGCYVRYTLDNNQVSDYKKAKDLKVALFHIQNPTTNLEIPLSLMGFTDAYDTLQKIESGELTADPVVKPAAEATEEPAAEAPAN